MPKLKLISKAKSKLDFNIEFFIFSCLKLNTAYMLGVSISMFNVVI